MMITEGIYYNTNDHRYLYLNIQVSVGERRLFYLLNENVPEFHLGLLLEAAVIFPRMSPALGISAPGDTQFANSGNGTSGRITRKADTQIRTSCRSMIITGSLAALSS